MPSCLLVGALFERLLAQFRLFCVRLSLTDASGAASSGGTPAGGVFLRGPDGY